MKSSRQSQPSDPGTDSCGFRLLLGIAATGIFGLLAAGLTLRSISLYGPGLSTDSAGYIRLARDVFDHGLAFLLRDKAVVQPPLYPMALAGLSWLAGIPLLEAAAWINAGSAAAITALLLLCASRITRSLPTLAVIGLLSCFSIPLNHVAAWVWTEPLFMTLAFSTLCLLRTRRSSATRLLLAGGLTALAFLTRYIGLVLIPVGAAFLFFAPGENIRGRLRNSFLFASFPSLLFLAYMIRNHLVSGAAAGRWAPSRTGIVENSATAVEAALIWFLPWGIRSSPIGLALVAIAVAGLAGYRRRALARALRHPDPMVLLFLGFGFAFFLFMVGTASILAYEPLNHRYWSPLYAVLLMVFAAALKPDVWGSPVLARLVFAAFCLFFAAAPVQTVTREVRRMAAQGAGGFNTREWRNSELMAHILRAGQPEGRIFSNAPDALYLLADVEAELSPAFRRFNSNQTTGVDRATLFEFHPDLDGAQLIWFRRNFRDYLYLPETLGTFCDLQTIREFSDGTIYRISKEKVDPSPNRL